MWPFNLNGTEGDNQHKIGTIETKPRGPNTRMTEQSSKCFLKMTKYTELIKRGF